MDAAVVLIPLLVPLIIQLLKYFVPDTPTALIPTIAPVLGVGVDYTIAYFAGLPPNPAQGAALGLAGVGVREVVNQTVTKNLKKDQP